MALSAIPYVPADGSIEVKDATGSPITLTVAYEDGDFQSGPYRQSNKSHQLFKDRGLHNTLRLIEEMEMPFSFSAHATEFADGTEKCIVDAFAGTGAWSSGVSTLGASAEVWAVTVTFTADTSSIGGDASTTVLTYCVGEVSFAEGVPGKFTVSGNAYLQSSSGIART